MKNIKIKICGLTSSTEAEYVNRVQADLAGIVLFFPKSKRNMTIEKVPEILNTLDKNIASVAVMVEPDLEQALAAEAAGFSYLQIHGNIREEILQQVKLPILKAFNVHDLPEWELYRGMEQIAGYVLDAGKPGSGEVFDWSLLEALPRDGKMFLLAGGLHAGNVAEAIRRVAPDGVDVSSGVEYDNKPGKDPEKIRAFVQAVRKAQV